MIELPEARVLAEQLTKELAGKKIERVVAGKSPHRFAFFNGDPAGHDALLRGSIADEARAYGGHVELWLGELRLDFSDGVNLRFLSQEESEPKKHQLYIRFDDGSALCASVQMYGGLSVFRAGAYDNPYYLVAHEKISPFDDGFDLTYFSGLMDSADQKKTSAKAFLATEQRIPGLGNGVLQDILWTAHIHPKRKLAELGGQETEVLYHAVKHVLRQMADQGGRDTEKDLHGKPGGYLTILSKNNTAMNCPACGGPVKKEAYLGGSVYYCPHCQG